MEKDNTHTHTHTHKHKNPHFGHLVTKHPKTYSYKLGLTIAIRDSIQPCDK